MKKKKHCVVRRICIREVCVLCMYVSTEPDRYRGHAHYTMTDKKKSRPALLKDTVREDAPYWLWLTGTKATPPLLWFTGTQVTPLYCNKWQRKSHTSVTVTDRYRCHSSFLTTDSNNTRPHFIVNKMQHTGHTSFTGSNRHSNRSHRQEEKPRLVYNDNVLPLL